MESYYPDYSELGEYPVLVEGMWDIHSTPKQVSLYVAADRFRLPKSKRRNAVNKNNRVKEPDDIATFSFAFTFDPISGMLQSMRKVDGDYRDRGFSWSDGVYLSAEFDKDGVMVDQMNSRTPDILDLELLNGTIGWAYDLAYETRAALARTMSQKIQKQRDRRSRFLRLFETTKDFDAGDMYVLGRRKYG